MRTHILAALLAVSASAYAGPSDPPADAHSEARTATESRVGTFEGLTYLEYMSLNTDARRQVFNKISVDKKADLVRAQVVSWREVHRKELNEDQLASIDELLTIIDPEFYTAQKSAGKQLHLQEVTERANILFAPEQIRELMFLESKQ